MKAFVLKKSRMEHVTPILFGLTEIANRLVILKNIETSLGHIVNF